MQRLMGREHLAKQLVALPFRRGDQQHQRIGEREQLVHGGGGDGGRFAGLAGAIEQEILVGGKKQIALPGIGRHRLRLKDQRRIEQQSESVMRIHESSVTRGGGARRCWLLPSPSAKRGICVTPRLCSGSENCAQSARTVSPHRQISDLTQKVLKCLLLLAYRCAKNRDTGFCWCATLKDEIPVLPNDASMEGHSALARMIRYRPQQSRFSLTSIPYHRGCATMAAKIHVERMMHRSSIAVAGESAASYALIKLIPSRPGRASPSRCRLNLALVLDVSGSMYEEDGTGIPRLKRVQDAAIAAISQAEARRHHDDRRLRAQRPHASAADHRLPRRPRSRTSSARSTCTTSIRAAPP